MYVCMYACMFMHACMFKHTHTHTRTRKHTHTTHTHTQRTHTHTHTQNVSFEIPFTLAMKKATLTKKLAELARTNHKFLVQIQCRAGGAGGGGLGCGGGGAREHVLCAVQMTSGKLLRALETGEAMEAEEVTVSRQSRVGQENFKFVVLAEFVQLVLDVAHVLLAVLTLVNPVRFVMLLVLLFEDKAQWPRRVDAKLLSASAYLRYACTLVVGLFTGLVT